MIGYLDYWALFDKPFTRPCGDYFFAAESQREAIAVLSRVVADPDSVVCLVAPRKCGLSTLMRHIAQMNGLGDCATETIITTTHRGRPNAELSLAQGLGIRMASGKNAWMPEIHASINSRQRAGACIIWMIDRGSPAHILFAHKLMGKHRNVTVVLGMTPWERDRSVATSAIPYAKIELTPLDLNETGRYLRDGLATVGGRASIFADNAVVRLHEMTQGAIADLAVAAEYLLALAAQRQLKQINGSLVESAFTRNSRAA